MQAPVEARRRPRRAWLTFVLVPLLMVVLGALVLPHVGAEVRTAPGASGIGAGSFPVVLVAGLASDGSGFARLTAALQRDGVVVLDFDAARPGTQPFTLGPPSRDDHVDTIAAERLAPQTLEALGRAGYDPLAQTVDVVAHSYGGLVARWLVEQEGWAPRVDDLVLVATPNAGSVFGFRVATLGAGHEEWDGVGGDMRPGSAILRQLAEREPPGETYTTIGGDPVALRWLRFGGHGFDGTVPAESALLPGAAQRLLPFTHGRLVHSGRAVALITATLRAAPP